MPYVANEAPAPGCELPCCTLAAVQAAFLQDNCVQRLAAFLFNEMAFIVNLTLITNLQSKTNTVHGKNTSVF